MISLKHIIDHNKSEINHKCSENAINSYNLSPSINAIDYYEEKCNKENYGKNKQ